MKPLLLLVVASASVAYGFPELTRHGYARCNTCHFSPNGGGILTEYGRALSKEILSAWAEENEEKALWGLVPLPERLALGGDARAAQTHIDAPTFRAGRFIGMGVDVEAAYTVGEWDGVASIGAIEGDVVSRRHYLKWRAGDNTEFRAGKFRKAYGLRVADHILEIKRGLGWDQGTETYNVEGAFYTDDGEFFATAVLGRPDNSALKAETGASLRGAWVFGDGRFKLGASYYYGSNSSQSRHVFGPYAILGLREDLFILAEWDVQVVEASGSKPDIWGTASYLRLDYEFFRGWHVFVAPEFSKLNLKMAPMERILGTVGLQVFPRPHFEFIAAYQHQSLKFQSGSNHFVWLMGHFYL